MYRLQAGDSSGGCSLNVLGIGSLEILLILIVAFVFLGPERLIDVARFLGNAVKEGRKLASEMPRIIVEG